MRDLAQLIREKIDSRTYGESVWKQLCTLNVKI